MNEPAAETYDVFIVHAQDDLEWARQVQARLSEDGFRAALEDYLPGDIIVRRIEELIRASRTCVFVYSRAIEADPMADAKYAALVSEAEARRFVPALLDDVPLGPFAASRKPLDFRGEDRDGPYRELLRVLGVDRSAGIPLPSHRRHRLEGAREVLLGIGRDAVVFAPGESQEVSHRPEPFTRALEERVWQLDRARRGGGGLPVPTKDGAVAGRPGALLEARLGEAGTELGETFLAGAAGEALAAAIVEAEAENRALRLGLQVDDEFAGLPWETLVLPGQAEPLALHPHVELFRHLPGAGCPTAMRILAPLRILAVVAAPEGPDSGPLLDLEAELGVILDSVEEARRHAAAHVRILNEGTLDAIETALKQERFHVLHVSCHAGPDALLLEDEHGGTDRVTAARLAGAIPRDRGVPLVVLSGCSTALDVREGDGGAALAGLARGLSAAGVPAVLAMTAPVTDRYATLFSGALYRELAVRPEPDVLTALSEARRDLERRRRDADGWEADLVEWATPALFLRGPSLSLYDVTEGVDAGLRPPKVVSFAPGVVVRDVGDFVGRRADLRTLLAALRVRPGVLLHGIGGVGKSSLAAELSRRLRDDAGLVVSVVGRAGPDQIMKAVGDRLLAVAFALGPEGEELRNLALSLREPEYPPLVRLDALGQALARIPAALAGRIGLPPITLLLDNFEDNLDRTAGFSFLDGDLPGFLAAWLRAGRLIVTSRHPFTPPGDSGDLLHPHHLGPLSLAEARKLMWRLPGLDALPEAERQRAWLDVGGHPRTLEYLDALLRGGEARFPDITRRMERLLGERGLPDPAGWLSGAGSGLDLALAEAVTLAVDDTLLRDLVGLLDDLSRELLIGASVYRLPVDRVGVAWPVGTPVEADPAREERLRRLDELVRRAGENNPEVRVEELGLSPKELEQAYEDVASWQAPQVVEPRGVDEALERLAWLGLLAPGSRSDGPGGPDTPHDSHGSHGSGAERLFTVHRWTAATLARPEITPAERVRAAHTAAARFWRWRVENRPRDPQRNLAEMLELRFHCHASGDLDAAGSVTDWVCERLHRWGAWSWAERLYEEELTWFPVAGRERAACLHQLGVLAHDRGEFDRALECYRRSLAVAEEVGDRTGMAASLHQLGVLAHNRGELGQAVEFSRRSLALHEETGDRLGVAAGYGQLGVLAHDRGELGQAVEHYRRSLAAHEEIKERRGVAHILHRLAMVAQQRGEFDRALEYYRRSLTIREETGDRGGLAAGLHQLGVLAHGRGEIGQAVEHYRRALAIHEDLGDQVGMAAGYSQLGVLAYQRMEFDRALEYYGRALAITERHGNRAGMAVGYNQIGGLHTEAGRAAEALAYTVAGLVIQVELRSPDVRNSLYWLGRQRELLGEGEFGRLLAEYLDAESVNTVIGWLDRPPG